MFHIINYRNCGILLYIKVCKVYKIECFIYCIMINYKINNTDNVISFIIKKL